MVGSVLHNFLGPNWKGLSHVCTTANGAPLISPPPIPLHPPQVKMFPTDIVITFSISFVLFRNLLVIVQKLGNFKIIFLLWTSSLIPPILREQILYGFRPALKAFVCSLVKCSRYIRKLYSAGVRCNALYPFPGVRMCVPGSLYGKCVKISHYGCQLAYFSS